MPPVFQLSNEKIEFPHPSYAIKSGLLAVGGDLVPERIILAYQNGIFPWNNQDEEILWWCLTPRLILYPHNIKLSRSMRRWMKSNDCEISFDNSFEEVIEQCSLIKRKKQDGTWIHQKLKDAFVQLHELGLAHSVEIRRDNQLIGGLYGLGIGKMFCGESMFAKESNTSKLALYHLCQKLLLKGYQFIDCQQDTKHLRSLGAELISKNKFFEMLEENKLNKLIAEKWQN